MNKKLNEMTPPVAPASPAKPAPTRNIGQDFAAAKKTISMMLTKLGHAFDEYSTRMSRLNMALQNKIGPLGAGASGAQDRIAQLEQDYQELKQTSQDQLQAAEATIADLRKQLQDALDTGGQHGELLRIAQQEMRALEQTISDKSVAVQKLMASLDTAKGRLQARAKDHDADRQKFAAGVDEYEAKLQQYEAKLEELKQANGELEAARDEAVDKFNKLLSGVTKATPEHTRNYGKFDLMEHLAKAKKKDKKNSADW